MEVTKHGRQRARQRLSIDDEQAQQFFEGLWAVGWQARDDDYRRFCTWPRPDTVCRVAVHNHRTYFIVRGRSTPNIVTVFAK